MKTGTATDQRRPDARLAGGKQQQTTSPKLAPGTKQVEKIR